MGACKSCGEVVSALDMVDGFCQNCQDSEQREKINVENEIQNILYETFGSFISKYKLYIVTIPLFLGIIIVLLSSMGNIPFEKLKPIGNILNIMAIILAFKFKNKIFPKIGMFFLSGLLMGIVYLVTIFLVGMIFNNNLILDNENNEQRQKVITGMLNMNSKMPMMLNDQFQIVKYSSPNNKTITMHGRFVNYTKNEILADYSNSISQFESEMLKDEQKTSCPQANLKNLFSIGLEMNIEYLGKNNNIVGKINLNDEKCKPYYQ